MVLGRADGIWRRAVFPLQGKILLVAKEKCVWRKIPLGGEKLSTEVLSMITAVSEEDYFLPVMSCLW